MKGTPLAEQMRIVLAGDRNSGKSSLMNNIFGREISIVAERPGTTTDPVTKSFELGALGAVAFSDTAGLDDDEHGIGELRRRRTEEVLQEGHVLLFVTPGDRPLSASEKALLEKARVRDRPLVVVYTFADRSPDLSKADALRGMPSVAVNNLSGSGVNDLRKLLLSVAEEIEPEISPVEGLVHEGDLVLLVTPIDLAAPRGRLILPQVETIRDLLDRDCGALVVKERELFSFYRALSVRPKVVICDSQVFSKVAADIPEDQPLTSFSILFGRKKGDLVTYIRGLRALSDVPPGARILVLESCSHHRQADDIGTVKIPRLFKQLVRMDAEFSFARDLPPEGELGKYFMVITCAGCMATRLKIVHRLNVLRRLGVHAINYGLFLAWANGLLPRALEPFPYEHSVFLEPAEDFRPCPGKRNGIQSVLADGA
ncbi:[FeFe] hydrogenase H-cluster maturation GTPase HydF [Aminiphilus sp.]|uniref:[FeFe] hydrogenase H-cluster maturation GTPase HydF n=1 Tax=Aminiphilus sp. TaxID=1872488 RepID=UPI00262DD0A7|nr:[FeFe] hydrogenase H-cluster maturation GTPase HydF [Aminiphilus sp.]